MNSDLNVYSQFYGHFEVEEDSHMLLIDSWALFFPVMVATQEEMEAAAVPMDKRDYCAHKYIKLMECHREKFPWASRCLPVKHEYEHCEYEE